MPRVRLAGLRPRGAAPPLLAVTSPASPSPWRSTIAAVDLAGLRLRRAFRHSRSHRMRGFTFAWSSALPGHRPDCASPTRGVPAFANHLVRFLRRVACLLCMAGVRLREALRPAWLPDLRGCPHGRGVTLRKPLSGSASPSPGGLPFAAVRLDWLRPRVAFVPAWTFAFVWRSTLGRLCAGATPHSASSAWQGSLVAGGSSPASWQGPSQLGDFWGATDPGRSPRTVRARRARASPGRVRLSLLVVLRRLGDRRILCRTLPARSWGWL